MEDDYDLDITYDDEVTGDQYDTLDDEQLDIQDADVLDDGDLERRASCSSNTCSPNCTSSCGSPSPCTGMSLNDDDLSIDLDQ